jgi:hypothetical protein
MALAFAGRQATALVEAPAELATLPVARVSLVAATSPDSVRCEAARASHELAALGSMYLHASGGSGHNAHAAVSLVGSRGAGLGRHSLRGRGDRSLRIDSIGVHPEGGQAPAVKMQMMSAPGRAALGASSPGQPSPRSCSPTI